MRRGGMPWVKAWTKATRFLGSMRSHRSPIIRGHRHAGPSPTRPPAAAQIRVICARSAVREAYPQEASKFAKVVKTTRDGRQLTRRYFAFGDTDPSEGPTTGGAACSGAHPQGCPPDCAGPPPRSAALPGPASTPPRTARTAGWPVSRSLALPRCWTPSGWPSLRTTAPAMGSAMTTSPLRRLPVQGCLDGAGNGKHRPQLRPQTHDPVGGVEQRHENGKHAEKDGLTAVPARRPYRLCRSQLHEDTSSETVSAQ